MLKRVMIISGESSGELYGALLAKGLKKLHPDIAVTGVGGERMASAGVQLISKISSAFGITEAIKTYSEIRRTFRKVVDSFKSFKPEVIVLIDYPDFNLMVAKAAKKAGIKVFYYVSPQVWAWRRKRVKVIGRLVDNMAVILPFEEKIYRQAHVPCEFVGHPTMDEIREVLHDAGFGIEDIGSSKLKAQIKAELGLKPDKPVMTLMPGSRHHEVSKLLPVIHDVIHELHKRYPGYQFVIPAAPNLPPELLSTVIQQPGVPIHLLTGGQSIKALLVSDCAVIASGTSALQSALLGVPMVVIYKLSPLTFFLGRLIVKVKHISLVNILLDKSVEDDSGLRIKEFLQDEANKENITGELYKIIDDAAYRNEMVSQLNKVGAIFYGKSASPRVAGMLEETAVAVNA